MESTPRYKSSHYFFIGFVSILLAAGVGALFIFLYRQTYTIQVEQIEPEQSYISADDLLYKMQNEEEITVIDVREPDEYTSGHIQGSISVPLGSLWNMYSDKTLPVNIPLVLYSNDRVRSEVAANLLRNEPFLLSDLAILSEGFRGWLLFEYPVVGTAYAEYITPVEVATRIQEGERITYLDVRSEREFMELHMRNAISIPFNRLSENLQLLPDDEQIVILDTPYNEAYAYLESIGWDDIAVLEGGLDAWVQSGYATATSVQAPFTGEES